MDYIKYDTTKEPNEKYIELYFNTGCDWQIIKFYPNKIIIPINSQIFYYKEKNKELINEFVRRDILVDTLYHQRYKFIKDFEMFNLNKDVMLQNINYMYKLFGLNDSNSTLNFRVKKDEPSQFYNDIKPKIINRIIKTCSYTEYPSYVFICLIADYLKSNPKTNFDQFNDLFKIIEEFSFCKMNIYSIHIEIYLEQNKYWDNYSKEWTSLSNLNKKSRRWEEFKILIKMLNEENIISVEQFNKLQKMDIKGLEIKDDLVKILNPTLSIEKIKQISDFVDSIDINTIKTFYDSDCQSDIHQDNSDEQTNKPLIGTESSAHVRGFVKKKQSWCIIL